MIEEDQHERERRTRWDDNEKHGWRKVRDFIWHHKLYRDIWLIVITVVLFGAVQAVNDSRRETLIRACNETNLRHDETIKQLDRGIASFLWSSVSSQGKIANSQSS
jgi:hypothetical protein